MANDLGGVWRTVGGRRIFIKDGKDLKTAMKESGKFKSKKDKEKEDKLKDIEHDIKYFEKMEEKYPSKGGLENNEDYKTLVEDYNNLSKELGKPKYEKESDKFKKKIDRNDIEALNKIADDYENINDYEGLTDIEKDYIKNRRQETSRNEFTKKANEIHEKTKEKAIEAEQTTDESKRYNTSQNIKEYYEKEKLGDPKSFEKGEQVTVQNEYGDKKETDYTIVREATKEEKEGKVNTNLKAYVLKDKNGNEIVKADIRINKLRGADGKAIDFNRKDETFKYNGSYNDNLMEAARRDSVMVETLGSRAVDEIRNGNITNEKQLYEFLETGSAYNGSKVVHGYGYGYYDLSHNMVWRDDLKGTKADKEISAQAKYWRDKATNELQQKTLPQRYKGTVEYLQNTTNMSSAEILKMLKEIDKDNKR